MDNKTRATWVNWILGLLLVTVAFGAGAVHFSNIANSYGYSEQLSYCESTNSCTIYDALDYYKTKNDELHWATVFTVLAAISGIICFSVFVSFLQTLVEKKSE